MMHKTMGLETKIGKKTQSIVIVASIVLSMLNVTVIPAYAASEEEISRAKKEGEKEKCQSLRRELF